jgi:hypothetical protein
MGIPHSIMVPVIKLKMVTTVVRLTWYRRHYGDFYLSLMRVKTREGLNVKRPLLSDLNQKFERVREF